MNERIDKPRRGRPPSYEPEETLAAARDVFWRSGYSAATLDDLSAATGLHRPSLYGAFGDKRALYLTTLERYVAEGRRQMVEALGGDRPLREALQRVYDRALAL